MVFHNFDELIAHVKSNGQRKIMAVACANDEHTLEAVVNARREGIVEPILVGDRAIIEGILTVIIMIGLESYASEELKAINTA